MINDIIRNVLIKYLKLKLIDINMSRSKSVFKIIILGDSRYTSITTGLTLS